MHRTEAPCCFGGALGASGKRARNRGQGDAEASLGMEGKRRHVLKEGTVTGLERVILDRSDSAERVCDAPSVAAHSEEGGSALHELDVDQLESGRRAGGPARSNEGRA